MNNRSYRLTAGFGFVLLAATGFGCGSQSASQGPAKNSVEAQSRLNGQWTVHQGTDRSVTLQFSGSEMTLEAQSGVIIHKTPDDDGVYLSFCDIRQTSKQCESMAAELVAIRYRVQVSTDDTTSRFVLVCEEMNHQLVPNDMNVEGCQAKVDKYNASRSHPWFFKYDFGDQGKLTFAGSVFSKD